VGVKIGPISMDEHGFRVFQCRVLTTIFGPEKEVMGGGSFIMTKLYNLYSMLIHEMIISSG
jgi:hypothetical protein